MITGCGGVIELSSGESQTIRSPNYPNAVPVDRECVWLVKARVRLLIIYLLYSTSKYFLTFFMFSLT